MRHGIQCPNEIFCQLNALYCEAKYMDPRDKFRVKIYIDSTDRCRSIE